MTKVRLALLALLAPLAAASPAAAHDSVRAPIIHAIDHARWETNALRRTAGVAPVPSRLEYRSNRDRAFRVAKLSYWRVRLAEAHRLDPHPSSVWARLAECESGGRWDYNGGSGFDGGLQFHPGTWSAYRLPGYPSAAWQASPAQQIRVARKVLAAQGWGAWPACSRALGLR